MRKIFTQSAESLDVNSSVSGSGCLKGHICWSFFSEYCWSFYSSFKNQNTYTPVRLTALSTNIGLRGQSWLRLLYRLLGDLVWWPGVISLPVPVSLTSPVTRIILTLPKVFLSTYLVTQHVSYIQNRASVFKLGSGNPQGSIKKFAII